MVWMGFGVAFYSFMISNLQHMAFDGALSKDTLKARINLLNELTRDTKIDDDLINRIKVLMEFRGKEF